ncbi:MAG: hypothetical protein KBG48_20810 [Kofleriaceae bacterium]|nr:hypothetical protein [Kofleriaceae bacterium]MBP9169857.1 hypothetical protein [Kofleriaceae bacterium]MBP9858052.1 hypothetical protein [Kofleriaceae bacterium]
MIVGVTGHQDLGGPVGFAWVRRALADQVAQCHPTSGLTCLAAGADQVFADVLDAAGIPFEVVVPCTGYEDSFASLEARSAFESLLQHGRHVVRLPYPAPSEEAFFAAGRYIVAHCELLFAVWNGLPARGLGGTGDVVAYAVAAHRPWIHIDPRDRSIHVHK